MLENASDRFVEDVTDRCLEAILDRHYNPAFGLLNEVLHHDLSRPTDGFEQFSYTGHAIETLWMVLFEAARRKDQTLHDRAAEMFRRHVEIAWDPVYGGFFRSLDHVDRNLWKTDKVLWLQEEVLIGTLQMVERTNDPWAREWFGRTYEYVREKYPLKQYGYPLWIIGADRKVTFEPQASRVENFHHPRHLMLNLLTLDRLIEHQSNPA
jgi:mannose/cellobiose epimerase-like protein (N-acyl-D-glucosamine 2-epimerase family)